MYAYMTVFYLVVIKMQKIWALYLLKKTKKEKFQLINTKMPRNVGIVLAE